MRRQTYLNQIILAVMFATRSLSLSVADEPPDFAKQIIPMLTKAGCNSGACHGAASGRGYLQLSLFGGRPAADFEALTHAPGHRYLDTLQAIRSLVLQKPSGFLEHGGGVRLDSDGADFRRFSAWIESGGLRGGLAKIDRLELLPNDLNLSSEVLVSMGEAFAVGAKAWWSDGSATDVSEWLSVEGASFNADPDSVVLIKSQGGRIYLTAQRPGVWPVTLRVASAARAIQIWCQTNHGAEPHLELPHHSQASDQPRSIDAVIARASQKLGLALRPPIASHLLVRRMWIDLLGRHPTLEEWQAATEQVEQGQKSRLVDQLLASPEFPVRAAQKITAWVADSSKAVGDRASLQQAISKRLASDDDLRALVHNMLAVPEANSTDQEPAAISDDLAAFHRFAADPRSRAELVAATWMGVRIGCAQCHDHPLDHWTQDDYFALAACWAEIDSKQAVMRIPGRTTSDLRSGEPAIPRLPDGTILLTAASNARVGAVPDAESLDTAFVRWLCSSDNNYLANNLANRLWQWCFGRGLVVDVDDHRETNPPANRELLTLVTQHLRANNFGLRKSLRELVLSDAYARGNLDSAVPPAERELQFRLLAARAPKEIDFPNFEALVQQTLPKSQANPRQPGVHAEGTETMTMMTTTSNRDCTQYTVCQDKFSQNLDIAAGATLHQLIANASELLTKNNGAMAAPEDLVAQLYRRLFGHEPDATRGASWQRLFMSTASNSASQRELLEDILWSLLVSDEFRRLH